MQPSLFLLVAFLSAALAAPLAQDPSSEPSNMGETILGASSNTPDNSPQLVAFGDFATPATKPSANTYSDPGANRNDNFTPGKDLTTNFIASGPGSEVALTSGSSTADPLPGAVQVGLNSQDSDIALGKSDKADLEKTRTEFKAWERELDARHQKLDEYQKKLDSLFLNFNSECLPKKGF